VTLRSSQTGCPTKSYKRILTFNKLQVYERTRSLTLVGTFPRTRVNGLPIFSSKRQM